MPNVNTSSRMPCDALNTGNGLRPKKIKKLYANYCECAVEEYLNFLGETAATKGFQHLNTSQDDFCCMVCCNGFKFSVDIDVSVCASSAHLKRCKD